MLEAGQAAPDFTLPDQDGNELTLSGLRGDPEGRIAKVFPKVSPKTHDEVVLEALATLASA